MGKLKTAWNNTPEADQDVWTGAALGFVIGVLLAVAMFGAVTFVVSLFRGC